MRSAKSNSTNVVDDPFEWQIPSDSIVTGNAVRAWWLRKKGYEYVGKISRPYTSVLGQPSSRVHYIFKAA